MDDNTIININNEKINPKKDIEIHTFEGDNKKRKTNDKKKWSTLLALGITCLLSGIVCVVFGLIGNKQENVELNFPKIPTKSKEGVVYSDLTGEPLGSGESKDAPTYCIQTPNGTDGARPQAGLTEAGVAFEAIAEAGITRFAAIYQNPSSSIIGPIRSLRIYYLEWDAPFDCTIVHAGGPGDAIAAVAAGGYKDLTESYQYMYRGTYRNRLWNNLFTTSSYLKQFSESHGYNTSDVKGFARLTPEESQKELVENLASEKLDITKATTKNTSEVEVKVSKINLRFGGSANFNVEYNYNAETNAYVRSYENGAAHEVYECPAGDVGERNPEDVCELKTVSPSVVVAMFVPEKRASDNYHEDITAIGTGNAYIFQNGSVIEGSWSKTSDREQIKFFDKNNNEVKLAPGQTFVSAIPDYGSIEY